MRFAGGGRGVFTQRRSEAVESDPATAIGFC
jgi:hypothetical protein